MGRATALTFAREGASVVGCDVTVEPAAATVEMVRAAGGEIVSLHPCRLSDPAECARLVELAVSEFGRFATPGQASSASSIRDPCRFLCKWPVRRAVRTLPRHHAAPSLARTVRRLALPVDFLRSGVPAGHGQAAKVPRARPRDDLHARRSRAACCFHAPFHTEPRAVPDRGYADRHGFWCRLQGDLRDRARSEPARKPRCDDVGPTHRALGSSLGSGDRSRNRAQPRRKRTQHRARVRHPRRAGRCRLGLGAAETPTLAR